MPLPLRILLCSLLAASTLTALDEGLTFSLSVSEEFDALHLEGGTTLYDRHGLSSRFGASLFISPNSKIFGNFDVGARASIPGVLSPFAGIGLFLGEWPSYREDATSDHADNDNDGMIDEPGETRDTYDVLAGVYPEAGLQLNFDNDAFISVHVRYYVTTEGRDSDRVLYGFTIGQRF
jgi:hypothetical protein